MPANDDLVGQLRQEVLWILIGYHALVRSIRRWQLPTDSRLSIADDLILFEALTRDLVMRLTRLDDDQANAVSLRGVAREVRKRERDQRRLGEIDRAVKQYRTVVNVLKTQHRNTYLAHLRPGEPSGYRTPSVPQEVPDAIRAAVLTIDVVAAARVGYHRSIGSLEGSVDLRAEFGI